jgi:hypothetical protein
MRKDIDLRSDLNGDPAWILFLARKPDVAAGSFAGHAFVGFGREDQSKQMSWQEGFGLYPQSGPAGAASLFFGTVPGHVVKEASLHSDLVISCRVSPSQYDAVVKVKEAWAKKTDYQLIYQDCVTFTLDAASKLGLRLPSRESLPDNISLPITLIQNLATNSTEDFPYGIWASSDPAKRWALQLNLDTGTWTERAASGAVLEQPTRITRLGDRKFRIERENNAEVLTFLGARDTVRTALLGRGVRPSYMTLERTSLDNFDAQWFGLRWSLDEKNNLKSVTQPGDAPGAAYTLTRKT